MQRLLNLFTDECVIYEPFGKGPQSLNNIREKICLKGKSEIESFLSAVMMASNGLQYQIEFVDKPIDENYIQSINIFDYTSSPSIVSVLATFYGNREGHKLKEKLTFHVVSRKNYDSANRQENDFDNNGKEIKTLCIQFCPPESTN